MSSDGGQERGAIARRAAIVLGGTLTSRILGAIRDAVIAACFAVGATDAWFVAWTIPNSLRVLLGEGAVSGAFVPVFSEVRTKEGDERAREFFAGLVGAMMLILALVTVAGVAAAPWLVTAYAGGYEEARFGTTVSLTRIVFPYIFLVGLAALSMGALNSLKRFAVPAFAPGLLNVVLIAAPFTLVPFALSHDLPAIASLAVAALVGGVLVFAAQVPTLWRSGLLRMPRFGWSDPWVKKALRLMVPLIAGLGVYQLNVLLSRLFASYLVEGSQSYLYYGLRLVEIPQGMFAFAIATAALPSLSDQKSRGEEEEAKRTFTYGLRLSLFVAVPSTVALVLLAEPTVAVIFGRGAFEASHVAETARSLVWQASGIWAVASVRTVIPMFHAYNDTRSPVICSAVNLVVFVGVSLGLMGPLAHVGIAIAFTAAAVAQLVVLLLLLRRNAGPLGLTRVSKNAARMAAAAAVMGVVCWAIARMGDWSAGGNDPRNIGLFAGAAVAGAVVYFAAARILGCPEVGELLDAARRRGR